MKPARPRSRTSWPATSLPEPSHGAPSPELLQTVEALRSEIDELKGRGSITIEEKAELAQLKTDLADARAEWTASRKSVSTPTLVQSRRIVHYGTFSTVEEDVGD